MNPTQSSGTYSLRRGAESSLLTSPAPRVAKKGRHIMLKTIPALGALGVSAMLLVPTATQAQDLPTARVSYADLDLSSDVGQHSLIRRMSFASDQLCGVGKWKQLGLVADASACSKDTLAGAQPAY